MFKTACQLCSDELMPSQKSFQGVIILLPGATNQIKAQTLNPTPDEQQFLDLINGNRPRILKICRVYAWNAADRDDLYQEILFQIWRALPGLKQDNHANTWLYRIAINTSISFLRGRSA